MTASALVHTPAAEPALLALPAHQNPALAYIASLKSPTSKRIQEHSLQTLTDLATGYSPDDPTTAGRRHLFAAYPWWLLRFQHTNALQAALYQRYDKQATVNRHLAALRRVLRFCWLIQDDTGQPLMSAEDYQRAIAELKLHKPETLPPGREITMRELGALFEAAAGQKPTIAARDTALLAIAFIAGARVSEVVAANVADYLPDGWLKILKGKRNKQRLVPLEATSCAEIDAWLTVRGDWAGPLLCATSQDKIVERRMNTRSAYERFETLARAAHIPRLGTHDARRTVASRLLREGVDLRTVQRILGHESADTTGRYDRRGDDEMKRAIQRLKLPTVAREG